jgi:hypothetical protein
MGLRYQDYYQRINAYSRARRRRNNGGCGDPLHNLISRLRCIHNRVSLAVLRFCDVDADLAVEIMQPFLLDLGFVQDLPNGDVAVICLDASPDRLLSQADVERNLLSRLSVEMTAQNAQGVRARCLAGFVHFWTDEVSDSPDVISLASLPAYWTSKIGNPEPA